MQTSEPKIERPSPARLSAFSRAILVATALGAAGLVVYWIGAYRGLYQWLVEKQLAWWDAYYPDYTAVVVILLVLAGYVVTLAVLAKLGVIRTVSEQPVSLDAVDLQDRIRAFRIWGQERKFRLVFLVVGIWLMGSGAVHCLSALTAGSLAEWNVSAPTSEQLPSRWLRLHGKSLDNYELGFHESSHPNEGETYIPLVPNDWKSGEPIRWFLERTSSTLPHDTSPGTFEGTLAPQGLPGMIRHEFQNRGLKPAEHCEVLQWGESPGSLSLMGAIELAMGALLALVTAVVWWLKARRAAPR